ncbi:hypothetical protein [Gallaecimonas xiamenensis]|uniref:Lipoprotein n=1 Tax=Gallaecimonas xiamenensis 3-C-1 TaxID=745411 RepID=K2JZE3_9GAMM|nr:hypothetical protein [Gallaecimonas xiamenensis]EKE75669.1 hypothetical protein B3C1_06303 [Gallaecimonas xiamenensis 3-C-1]
MKALLPLAALLLAACAAEPGNAGLDNPVAWPTCDDQHELDTLKDKHRPRDRMPDPSAMPCQPYQGPTVSIHVTGPDNPIPESARKGQ